MVTTDPEARGAPFQDDTSSVPVPYLHAASADTFSPGTYSRRWCPDLREITDASYIDPLTEDLVFGNSGVIPATLTNYDLRAEWFWNGGFSHRVDVL